MSGELPPLPPKRVINRHLPTGIALHGYNAEDMRAYAGAAVAAALEQALEQALEDARRYRIAQEMQDARRYRWLKSRQGLRLRSERPDLWTRPGGTKFAAAYSLAEGGTQHAPAESLDALIDAAMLNEKGNRPA